MGVEEIVGLVLIFLVVVIPVLGFTARFALKPIVESIVELRGALLQEEPARRQSVRTLELEEELDALRTTVARLQGAREWDRALREGGGTLEEEAVTRSSAEPGKEREGESRGTEP